MPLDSSNSKRIAKNTMMLYIRMLFMMVISLYTSRVVLNVLGVIDYGIYNVVAGLVILISFLRGTLGTTTVRYLSFELGKKSEGNFNKIFSSCITVQLILAVIVLIISETIGLWFIANKMQIPADRYDATLWCYQFSIMAIILNLLQVPYNSAIISYEKMGIFAYFSIIDAVFKLLIAFLIDTVNFDKLIFYSFLLSVLSLIMFLAYSMYCKKKLGCHYDRKSWDGKKVKEILSYTSWNVLGSLAAQGKGQALNILLNLIYGPALNAVHGIATKVSTVVSSFAHNFLTATRPQIIKNYANKQYEDLFTLVFYSSKFSVYLIALISMPIIIEAYNVLHLWLGLVPDYLVIFVRLALLEAIVISLSFPLNDVIQAAGRVRFYNLSVSILVLMNFPISYVFLNNGFPPQTIYYVMVSISVLSLFLRLWLVNRFVNMPYMGYIRKVLVPCAGVVIVSFLLSYSVKHMLSGISSWTWIVTMLLSAVMSAVIIFYLGLGHSEREKIISVIKNKLKKHGSK